MDIKVLQLHKRSSYQFKNIQDKYAINIQNKSFALADGTTQSFKSEFWAELITKKFVSAPNFNAIQTIDSFKNEIAEFKNADFEFSSNPAKASLEKAKQKKGGTATFIGLQFTSENKVEIISCGDTNLFLLNSKNKVIGFPFSDVDSLDANNYFINTEQLHENILDETFFKLKTIGCKVNDRIILASDAISRLILKVPSTLSELLKIENFNQLNDFCLKYWERKELQEDDISLIIIPVQNSGSVKIIEPPSDFSFPKEKEEEFIPASFPQNKHKIFTDMEFNEIRNQFNNLEKDFFQVKKNLKLNELLMKVVISLLLVNILFMNLFRSKNPNVESSKSEPKLENIITDKYKDTIDELNSEIKDLKIKVAGFPQSKEEQKVDRVEDKNETPKISKEEAKKRQEELIKSGYKVTADGIWGEQSEKFWNQFLQKGKVNNK